MFRTGVTRLSRPLGLRFGKKMVKSSSSLLSSLSSPYSRSSPFHSSSWRMMSSFTDPSGTAFSGSNGSYMDAMYSQWKTDPTSVHASWQAYFATGTYDVPPTLLSPDAEQPQPGQSAVSSEQIKDAVKLVQLARAYQVRGHYYAKTDPLGIEKNIKPAELNPEFWGFSSSDMDRVIDTSFIKTRGIQSESGMTLRHILERFEEIYCSNIGYQYMHIANTETCDWIRDKIETRQAHKYSKEDKLKILDRMTWAEEFEKFLAVKQSTAKRFGLEGGESSIPGIKAAIYAAGQHGVEDIVIGMPHRGRLNVLGTVMRKPLEQIFYEFNPGEYEHAEGSKADITGDVKYHLGYSVTRKEGDETAINLSLAANPSHLEAVNPVVCGKVRAKQFYKGDTEGDKVMGILLHGDAAMAGQGIVYETMGMSLVDGYSQGGTFHLVVNNQVGFTTPPKESRSMEFCSDLGKSLNCPIFRVNGDDPEAVSWACALAVEFRCKFKSDVIVDLVCYRRHGHNEIDEPMFTQPLMYNIIKNHTTTLNLYRQRLLEEVNDISEEEIQGVTDRVVGMLNEKWTEAQSHKPSEIAPDHLAGNWSGMSALFENVQAVQETGVSMETLQKIGTSLSTLPDDFNVHRRIKAVYAKRLESIQNGSGVDWGTAEALAFGTLLEDGSHIRLSGEDVERGTFSHRHCAMVDQKDEHKYTPLNELSSDQGYFSVHNSILSEYGVLGFELGYSLENPNALVLWEAQFGDFVNGAQIMIDNFICNGEVKWLRQSGLVMLLPHGYEGQGPEHSSARLERFLQQGNDNPQVINKERPQQAANWIVANCTTPANYFHLLRRQMIRPYRKVCVLFSPKQLLRFPLAVSDLTEMGPETFFKTVIGDDSELVNEKVTKLIACSGKVYYDIMLRRQKLERDDVAIIRLEQLFPFPYNKFQHEVEKYPNAKITWCQEEPMNMGGWSFVEPRIRTAYEDMGKDPSLWQPEYVGRKPSASTSTGKLAAHNYELETFLTQLFEE